AFFKYNKIICSTVLILLALSSCRFNSKKEVVKNKKTHPLTFISYSNAAIKTIHIFVALCDNKYQGIVPVPPKIGNGQDPDNNLYWGGDFGVRTYFKKSKEWKLVKKEKVSNLILERLIFKNNFSNYYLIADAYDGKYIKQTTIDFLNSCSGQLKDTLHVNHSIIGFDGNACLLAYIGHDGLMDFRLPDSFGNIDGKSRDCIILACVSKTYFGGFINSAKAYPLVWTTGLMCPEAYTLHDAISGYIIVNESHENIRERAVMAYNKYQKSGIAFARGLLVSGR
ncbi:hypothetical protein, partial [uncultured Mucilaginibacter sp.]|uniref:hypothetical protein n=1 Tax=uncultured Mucilaginibacter sp. TaxID=797541 RepID=UPI00345C1163